MSHSLNGKIAIVTGGASGIGLATVKAFLDAGALGVTVVDIAEASLLSALKAFAPEEQARLLTVRADVSEEEDVKNYVDKTIAKWGRLDISVQNAGISMKRTHMLDLDVSVLDRIWKVNVRGTYLGIQHSLKAMLASPTNGAGCSVVVVSSQIGLDGFMGLVPYAASKFAVRGIMSSVAQEVGPLGVRVNAVCPGPIDTPLFQATPKELVAPHVEKGNLKRVGRADEIAAAILFLASDAGSYCSGTTLSARNLKLKLPREESTIAPDYVTTNLDTDPSTPEQRLWGVSMFSLYWISDILVISGWQKCGAAITLGLDWRGAIGAVVLGSCFLGLPLCLNGYMGSVNRIPFPIAIRASHGYHLAKFPVISRAVTASFWFAIQSWNGQACIRLCLAAIWPSFLKMKNHVPASAGFTSQQMVAYLVFWMIQFPCLFIHPSKLRPLFIVKAITVPACCFGILGWSVHTAKATGSLGAMLSAPPKASGLTYAFAFFTSMNALIGGFSTLALNIPDFSRYSKNTSSPLVQAPLIPVIYLILSICAVLSASCSQIFNHGTALWSPIDIVALWGVETSRARAATFFAAFAWFIAQMTQNCSANSVSAANDLATLFPKYHGGVNWRAVVALVVGITPNLPGLVHAINAKVYIGNYGARWIYSLSWIYGFFSVCIVYTSISLLFPDKSGSQIEFAVHPDDFIAQRAAERAVRGAEGSDVGSEKGSEGDKSNGATAVLPSV
ncbi:putative permease [Pseudohyphozyma bogoriensis]|nr:putative permease [Pseudohyphozyma bogoriensis]